MARLNCKQIVERARERLQDKKPPYLWEDTELVDYLNDYLEEISRETLIFRDSKAIGYISRTDISFSSTTKNITTVAGNFITLGFMAGQSIIVTGSTDNDGTYTIASTAGSVTETTITVTGTLVTEIAGDTVIIYTPVAPCRIVLTVGTPDYQMDHRVFAIDQESVRLQSNSSKLEKTDNEMLDVCMPDWRDVSSDITHWMTDYNEGYITFYGNPDSADSVLMSVFRYPLQDMTWDSESSYPELPREFHFELIDGICARAYEKNDSEVYDPKKADRHRVLSMNLIEKIKKYVKNSRQPSRNIIWNSGAF
jgi:hypothetical protein